MYAARQNRRHVKGFQRGQALPLGLAFLMLGALFSLVLFNTGQMASEKTRVANTTDAAVYSGLIWQARTLNFQAYTNRAMVANQVSIAQMVSLSSWTNYAHISSRNLDIAVGWIPIVAPFTSALEQATSAIESVVSSAAEVAIPIIDGIIGVLSVMQETVYSASFVATPLVVDAVVNANDPRYSATTAYSIANYAQNAEQWSDLTQRYDDEEGLQRKAAVINASLDDFSADRGWRELSGLPSPMYVTPVDRLSIVKEGESRLIQEDDDWEWKGKDTISAHWEHWSCRRFRCRWRSTEIPMGWGGAFVEDDIECSGSSCPGWAERNRLAEEIANLEQLELDAEYEGVRAYRGLRDLSDNNRDPRLSLRVEVEVEGNEVRTASQLTNLGSNSAATSTLKNGIGEGMFHTEEVYASNAIASVSSGEVYFQRPAFNGALIVNGEMQTEYANLFNPYWDVRLTETSESQRLLAWGARSPQLVASGAAAAGDLQSYAQASGGQAAVEQVPGLLDTVREQISDWPVVGSFF